MREGSPEGDDVALAPGESLQPGFRVHVPNDHVAHGKPKAAQPLRHGIESRGAHRTKDRLPLHRLGRARHFGKGGIMADRVQNGTVRPRVYPGGIRFVIAHAHDFEAAFEHGSQGGQSPARADAPLAFPDARNELPSRGIALHFQYETRFTVPAPLFAVPGGKSLMLGQPRRFQGFRLLRRSAHGDRAHKDGKGRQTTPHCCLEHRNLPKKNISHSLQISYQPSPSPGTDFASFPATAALPGGSLRRTA